MNHAENFLQFLLRCSMQTFRECHFFTFRLFKTAILRGKEKRTKMEEVLREQSNTVG